MVRGGTSPPVDAALEVGLHLVEFARERPGRQVLPAAIGQQHHDRAGVHLLRRRAPPRRGPPRTTVRRRSPRARRARGARRRHPGSRRGTSRRAGSGRRSRARTPRPASAGPGRSPRAVARRRRPGPTAWLAGRSARRPSACRRSRDRPRRRRCPGSRPGSRVRSSPRGRAGWHRCRTGTASRSAGRRRRAPWPARSPRSTRAPRANRRSRPRTGSPAGAARRSRCRASRASPDSRAAGRSSPGRSRCCPTSARGWIESGPSRPVASRSSISALATRSLTDPVGFAISSLANRRTAGFGDIRAISTSGV